MIIREQYDEELLQRLQEHLRRYPEHTEQDIVKFVFQGMLGVGHFLASFEQAASYAAEEMQKVQPDPEEQLVERLSPAWQRLNLRRAKADNIPPEKIAQMMFFRQGDKSQFGRADVYRFCCEHTELGSSPSALQMESEKVLDAHWLPSHSDVYKAAYHPAYRVISVQSMEGLLAGKR